MTLSHNVTTDSQIRRDPESELATPMWLRHHHRNDRCARVGRHHVCRRCLVLYPSIVVTAILATVAAGTSFEVTEQAGPTIRGFAVVPAIWLLVAPMTVDWVLEHAGRIAYSVRRQTLVSVAAGVGGGLALAIHVQDPFNLRAALPIAAMAATCLVSALLTVGRSPAATTGTSSTTRDSSATSGFEPVASGSPAWLRQHELDEAERFERLTRLLDRQDSQTQVASGDQQHS